MEDDLYGDLVTSEGDVGAGLLKEKASAGLTDTGWSWLALLSLVCGEAGLEPQ
jgi:hypothetical protein